MNLLILSSWFPYPPANGSRIRAWFLLRELVRAGHTVRLVAGLQADVADEKDAGMVGLREMGIAEVVTVRWHWYNARKSGKWGALRAALSPVPRSILETPNPVLTQAIAEQLTLPTDAVLVFEMGMDTYLPRQLPPGVPLILDGAEVSGMVSPASSSDTTKQRATAAKAVRYWQKRLRHYATVTSVSPKEAEAVKTLLQTASVAAIVVPNGVDIRTYAPRDWAAVKPGFLIYNGSPDYGPNYAAVEWFGKDVLPIVRDAVPEACLWVTGTYTLKKAEINALGPMVYLTGFVPDLRPFLAEAAVCVVPLHYGGGTRLKILEAWAAGVPVVSTTIGANGLDGAIPGTHFLQADTPEDFANATVRLLTDPALCRTLSENARALVAQRYDWLGIGEILNQVLSETCRANKPS